MRCCVCASGCRASTTNLRKHEELKMRRRWIFLAPLAMLAVSAVRRRRRRSRAAVVELAAAVDLRLAPDYLLAGAWSPGAVPDPVRRIRTPRGLSLRLPSSHGRAVGAHDPRGAGTIPARPARTLRRRPVCQREQEPMTPRPENAVRVACAPGTRCAATARVLGKGAGDDGGGHTRRPPRGARGAREGPEPVHAQIRCEGNVHGRRRPPTADT